MRLEAPPLLVTFLIASTMATAGVGMAVVAKRDKPRAIEQFASLVPVPAHFEERWLEPEPVTIKKQDRLLLDTPPLLMRTERISVPTEGEIRSSRRIERKRNVCERHGMRKVRYGRRGWRCR